MISLENRFFPLRSAVCFLIEGGIILCSILVSFVILRELTTIDSIELRDVLIRGIVVAFFCQICMYMLDLYDLKHSQSKGELFFSLVFSVGFVCIGIGLISYIVPAFGLEGELYYLTIVFVAVFLLLWRVAFDIYLAKFAPKENVLIVGSGAVARMVAEEIKARQRLGMHLAGLVSEAERDENLPKDLGPVFGGYSNLGQLIEEHRVRKIVVAIAERRGRYPVREMLDVRVRGRRIVEWPAFFEKLTGRIPIDHLAPSFFIFNEGFRKSPLHLLVRRVASAVVALIGIVVLLPVFLFVAFLIKLDSPGPVLYSQDRVGQNGKVFRIFKFRSMRQDAEETGSPQWAVRDDARVTRVGRTLRKLRIDELPQLLNILRGDLDLVGPRPERPEFVRKLQEAIPYYGLRHTVKPGLTGWAQVMFCYCGTIEESKEKLQYDLFYVKNMSIKLDLFIIFRTLKIVVLGRGAR